MTLLIEILSGMPMLLYRVFIEYRFFNKIFQGRISMPMAITVMVVINMVAGQANVYFELVGTIPGHTLYYGTITFLMHLFLFKGAALKILFFEMFIVSSLGIATDMLIPFCHSIWGGDDVEKMVEAIKWTVVFTTLLYGIYIECIGRRLQYLKYDLPKDYTVYLMITMLFVYVANFAVQEVALIWGDGHINLATAFGCFFFAIVGITLVVVAIFAVDRQVTVLLRRQQYDLQMKNFKYREEEWRRIAGFKHDFKNHLICLNGLMAEGRTNEAQTYTTKLADTVEQLENKVYTGNDYADAILGAKYNEALSKGIGMFFDMSFPCQIGIEPSDLCCILSNITDNAIEECMRMEESKRWIAMKSFISQQQLVIEIKNSLSQEVKQSNGKIISSKGKNDHGFGIENVRRAVEKYNGVADISTDECFTFSVLLPMNHS